MSGHTTLRTLPRFLVTGVVSTIVNYALFWVLLRGGMPYGPAYGAGFMLGVVVGFVLNHSWTFASHGASGASVLGRYLGVYAVSMAAGYLLLDVLVSRCGIDARIANLFTIVQATVINYIGTRFLVFAR